MGVVEHSGGLGLALAADPSGLGLGLGQDRVAGTIGLTGNRDVLGLSLSTQLGGDLPASLRISSKTAGRTSTG